MWGLIAVHTLLPTKVECANERVELAVGGGGSTHPACGRGGFRKVVYNEMSRASRGFK